MASTFAGQSQNIFLKTVGGTRSDEMHQMIRSHDGGFIMAGSTESYGQGNYGNTDAYVVKTDTDDRYSIKDVYVHAPAFSPRSEWYAEVVKDEVPSRTPPSLPDRGSARMAT